MVQAVAGALVGRYLPGWDLVLEVDPVFSLLVCENDDFPDEMFGEASMGEVGSNVAYGGWVGGCVTG